MEKVTRFLPLGLFCVFSVKLMTRPHLDIADAAVLLVVGGFSAFILNKRSAELQELKEKIEKLEQAAQKDAEEIASNRRDIEDTKALVGGIKLGQQLRPQINRI